MEYLEQWRVEHCECYTFSTVVVRTVFIGSTCWCVCNPNTSATGIDLPLIAYGLMTLPYCCDYRVMYAYLNSWIHLHYLCTMHLLLNSRHNQLNWKPVWIHNSGNFKFSNARILGGWITSSPSTKSVSVFSVFLQWCLSFVDYITHTPPPPPSALLYFHQRQLFGYVWQFICLWYYNFFEQL